MSKKNKKGKKAISIEELFHEKFDKDDDIQDAEFTEINDLRKKKSKLNVGSKADILHKARAFDRMTEELKYRAAASKFKKEQLDKDTEEATADDVEKLRKSAIAAVKAFAEKAGLEKKYAEDVIDMLKDSDPEKTVKIAERIQNEIAKSEKLRTYNNWFKRGMNGEGWYFDPDKDDYRVDKLYGLPLDNEAATELGRILEKYREPYQDNWNGYWGPMRPNIYEEERMANEAQKRAQASYSKFIEAALMN